MVSYQIALYRMAATKDSGLNERVDGCVFHAGRLTKIEDSILIQPISAGPRTVVERALHYYVAVYGKAFFVDGSRFVSHSMPWEASEFLDIYRKLG